MKIWIALLLLVLLSCNQKAKKNILHCNESTGINDSLYSAILKYQKANPIPKIISNKLGEPPTVEAFFKYIYEVRFFKKQDTLITITLKLDGVEMFKSDSKTEVYGVYQDSCLKPTYFIIDKGLKTNLLKTIKTDSLENYYYNQGTIIDYFYNMDVYKTKGKQLIFIEEVKGSSSR